MADLIDLQKELGIKPGEMSAVASRLHVLRFDWDKKGVNVVSSLDHVIVFVSPHYNGDQPEIGDVWLCSVEPHSSVFWAYPLMRITSSFLMGLSDGMREEIYDSLWATNRKEFEKEFEKRYRESAMVAAREQLEKSHRAEIAGMQARIEALKTENEQNRILLQSRSSHA
ncbi:MAG: hypothetical protein Q4Q62_08395, partial [Thermoplasmata archaeon]|nr:hypothetical protein [Thermoplasmata archaeon]